MNSVYGYVLEREMPNINLEFCNELAQFDYMFQSSLRESYYGDIVLEGISLKGIWEKIKELWAKFKKWVVEKFNKLREFIKRIFHKTKKDVVDKKIEVKWSDMSKVGLKGAANVIDDMRNKNNQNNKGSNQQATDPAEPQYISFTYNTMGSWEYFSKIKDIDDFLVSKIFDRELAKAVQDLKDRRAPFEEVAEAFRNTLEYAKETGDNNYEKIMNVDFSDLKEVEAKVALKGVDVYEFKAYVKQNMEKIRLANKDITDKMLVLNRDIDDMEDAILALENRFKKAESNINAAKDRIAAGENGPGFTESDVKLAKLGTSVVHAVQYDITRCRDLVLYMSTHSSNLLKAANDNNTLFGRLERIYLHNGRPTEDQIQSISKQTA